MLHGLEMIPETNVGVSAQSSKPGTQERKRLDRHELVEYIQDYTHENYLSRMANYLMIKRVMLTEIHHVIQPQRKNFLDFKVKDAQAKNMIFTLLGFYPAVRYQLRQLGWLEKIDSRMKTQYDIPLRKDCHVTFLDSAPLMMKYETPDTVISDYLEWKLMSDMVDTEPDLVFSLRRNHITWSTLHEDTLVSYFPKCSFCSKLGLNVCLNQMVIFNCNNDSLKYPRGYNLTDDAAVRRFTQDFREASCFSLMRFVKYSFENAISIHSTLGLVPMSTFDFAETLCKKRIRSLQLEFVETYSPDRYTLTETEEEAEVWLDFENHVFNLLRGKSNFMSTHDIHQIYSRARNIVEKIDSLSKQELFNGMYNTWVIKPAANCSGHGVKLYANREKVTKTVYPLQYPNTKYTRFAIQKYIERPMLIYGVKFDLRFWFMITHITKFKIWAYHEGYVRFCSKPYSHLLLEEIRHLTNVRIQRKYRTSRDPPLLPPELMWDFQQLRDHFTRTMNLPQTWDRLMKAMEEAIVTLIQCAITGNHLDLRANCFQLFGADFLIHENHEPCLLEVNNGPGLSPTSSIIAQRTTELLCDMASVITLERNPLTGLHPYPLPGNFHLIYVKDVKENPLAGREKHIEQVITVTTLNLTEWRKRVRKCEEGRKY